MALSRSVFPPQLQFTKFGIEVVVVVVVVEAVVVGWVREEKGRRLAEGGGHMWIGGGRREVNIVCGRGGRSAPIRDMIRQIKQCTQSRLYTTGQLSTTVYLRPSFHLTMTYIPLNVG